MPVWTTDEILAAANLTAATWLLFLAVVSGHYAFYFPRTDSSDMRLMLVGIGVEASGWAMHRFYWAVVRHLRGDFGDATYLYWSNLWWPQAVMYTFIVGGLILVLTPVWKMLFGVSWRWLPAALVLATLWFYLLLGEQVDFGAMFASEIPN